MGAVDVDRQLVIDNQRHGKLTVRLLGLGCIWQGRPPPADLAPCVKMRDL